MLGYQDLGVLLRDSHTTRNEDLRDHDLASLAMTVFPNIMYISERHVRTVSRDPRLKDELHAVCGRPIVFSLTSVGALKEHNSCFLVEKFGDSLDDA